MVEILLGTLAALCTTFSLLPQAIRIFNTNQVNDLSLSAFLLIAIGQSLWLGYGLLRLDLIIIIANALSVVITSYIVWKKLKSLTRAH